MRDAHFCSYSLRSQTKMAKKYAYFNGKIITLDKVKINPYDLGFLRGYGVFDVMCTQNGKPFLLDEHWARIVVFAKEMKLCLPVNKKEFSDIITKLLQLNKFSKSTIRTVLTGGESGDAFTPCGKETFLILVEKFQPLPKESFTEGVGVATLNFSRYLPRVKITNYVEAIRNLDLKKKNKALEITYVKDGELLENSMSNIFIFKNNTLITSNGGVLMGTTRNLVVKLAKKKFKVEERKVSEKEFRNASEVFLTGANKDIVPVVRIDNKKVGDGKVGKNTKVLMEEFRKFVKKY